MKKTLLILAFFSSIICFAQNEASNWYFGYGAGIKFNPLDNSVSSVNDGQLSTIEGCTSISDSSGNLLFYTDGIIVWNKNHQIMLNGTGLIGDPSSTQSAIIIPKPNDSNIYYIFTVDDQKNNNDPTNLGLNYSEVDIRLDGGLGALTTKNINLVQESSEKVTAVVKDCITKSIWVVTFASKDQISNVFDTFYAFEVGSSGVNPIPVTSTFSTLAIEDGRGYLKLSPDGTKMACANVVNGLYLFDFDTTTGTVSNQQSIRKTGNNIYPYGVEFSPNSKLLYVHFSNDYFGEERDNPANHSSSLVQYNLISSNIEGSAVTIDDRTLFRGGLQLGPNGKIYRALSATYSQGSQYLGVINNPNILGTSCNYQHNAIGLASRYSSQGLPPFIASFFAEKIDIIGDNRYTSTNLPLCDGTTYTLKGPNIPNAKYTWTHNNLLLSENDFDLEVSQPGVYKVLIDPKTGDCEALLEGAAVVTYSPNPVAYNTSLTQCDEDGIVGGYTRFNLNEANSSLTAGVSGLSTKFYSDSNRTIELNATNFNYDTDNPQPVYVKVINDTTECFDISELTLNVSYTQIDDFVFSACDETNSEDGINTFNLNSITSEIQLLNHITDPIRYYRTFEDALLEQNNLGTSFTNNTPYKQTIYFRVESNNNCFGISKVLLTINKLPPIEANANAWYCLNKFPEPITLKAGISNNSLNNYTYNWSTGENTYEIKINQTGIYTVTVTNANGCSKDQVITVEPSNIATIESIDIKDATHNNTITVLVFGEGSYEYRLLDENNVVSVPFQSSPIFENVKPGLYTLSVKDVKNNCGTTPPLKISVIGFPKVFTPNGDGFNDIWQVYGVSSMFQPNTKVQIFDRLGKLLKEITPLGEGWNGLFNGEEVPVDDYWFSVKLQDGRVFKNHFTLKR
ncbi:T9SS type B sorting domain-containing protein [Mariniflexile litorale]|uniref:T9SS type B sorting domain-containing protein n=1 Tax=Mariniflexile litorale TaxID=3045158 RepID=A0AAU7EF29_9FLAO|nr:T9SS type B sorting domain-containing protein [Mariniflexile sp. KMM 9835]MDQ8210786.1 T9SS type B sorting domain-containing protein [Mariniflexile sp. KMM 9835]